VLGFRLYVEEENHRAQEVYRRRGLDRTRYIVFEDLRAAN
jgi:ribosomal protein S18 acetylase RimI-like enzyme